MEHAHDPRAGTVLGWIAGGSLALLANYGLATLVGPSYPVDVSTFVVFALGAFGGMKLADRLGGRAVRVLGPIAGVLLASLVAVLLALAVLPRG